MTTPVKMNPNNNPRPTSPSQSKNKERKEDVKSIVKSSSPLQSNDDVNPNTSPISKLIFFSLLILILPLLTYFQTRKYLQDDLYAALSAALMANVILAIFVIMAMREDSSEKVKMQ